MCIIYEYVSIHIRKGLIIIKLVSGPQNQLVVYFRALLRLCTEQSGLYTETKDDQVSNTVLPI